jgi:DNA primase
MESAGLILKKEGSDHFYDRFRGRLIFPICDEQGRVIGFSGRLLDEDAKAAKYVNSPETPIFHKSKVFFGLDKAKRPILDAETAIVCEGQLDLIGCHMAGIQNVVAPQGTAFTADHARILRRYVEEVVLCFDSDQAGQNAAVRALDTLMGADLAIRVALVPNGHDPDSYIRQFGADAFRKVINDAQQFFDFYLNRLCTMYDPDSDRGRMSILREMAESVKKTGNHVLMDSYAQKTAQRLGVDPQAVRLEFRKVNHRSSYSSPIEPSGDVELKSSSPPPSAQEGWLLKIILLHEELVSWVGDHLDVNWLRHDAVRSIVQGPPAGFPAGIAICSFSMWPIVSARAPEKLGELVGPPCSSCTRSIARSLPRPKLRPY